MTTTTRAMVVGEIGAGCTGRTRDGVPFKVSTMQPDARAYVRVVMEPGTEGERVERLAPDTPCFA